MILQITAEIVLINLQQTFKKPKTCYKHFQRFSIIDLILIISCLDVTLFLPNPSVIHTPYKNFHLNFLGENTQLTSMVKVFKSVFFSLFT